MKKRVITSRERKGGVALIISVGILALLAMIATSFAINMQLEYKAAVNQLNYIKATVLAEAGIEKAIAELQKDAKENFVYGTDPKTYQDSTLSEGFGFYEVDIKDEQRKVNINYANRELLKALLGDSDYIRAAAIINYRGVALTNPFKTIEEIKLVSGIDDATYKNIKDDITVNSYLDPNTINDTDADEPRCPINVNTASQKVLKAILLGISDGPNTILESKAALVADDIMTNGSPKRPFSNWTQFKNCLDNSVNAGHINPGEATLIMNNCNPNRQKPSTYTTDLCFYSGGRYTLISTGRVYDSPSQTNKLSEKKIKAIVYIYDILNQTKKSQFQGNDGDAAPVAFKVNTFDSCPVEPIDSTNSWEFNSTYTKIPDSIKNGFWDNMNDSGASDLFYVNGMWHESDDRDSYLWVAVCDDYEITDEDGDGDKELVLIPLGPYHIPKTILGTFPVPPADLNWDNFAWRSTFSDGLSPCDKRENQKPIPPGIDYKPWDVMVHWSRCTVNIWGNETVDESRMKQEYGDPPVNNDIGQLETHIGKTWPPQSGLIQGAYHLPDNPINTFITVSSGNNHYFYAYKANEAPYFQKYVYNTYTSPNSSGQIGWAGWGAQTGVGEKCWVKGVRIIPGSGPDSAPAAMPHFESRSLTGQVGDVSWGTIGATVTLSDGANPALEKIYFQTSIDGGTTWTPASPGILPGDALSSSQKSSSIQYRANFTTLNDPVNNHPSDISNPPRPFYGETIALEDITVTYLLPEMEIIYYKVVSAD